MAEITKKSKKINVNYRIDFLYIHSMVYSNQKNSFYSLH